MVIDNFELYVDDEQLEDTIEKFKAIKEQASSIASKIAELSATVNGCLEWLKNGKEECGAFLELMASYSNAIAGMTYAANVSMTQSALSGKSVTGGGDHATQLEKALNEFAEESKRFEKGGDAESVILLDSIQGD